MRSSGPITVVDAPDALVIELAEARLHARATDVEEEDVLFTSWIRQATERAQSITRRQLLTATCRMVLDAFPRHGLLVIERVPLIAVTSIEYYDEAGALQTLSASNYVVDADSEPARVWLADGFTWPATQVRPNAVRVNFTCGYGEDPAAVPDGIKDFLRVAVAERYRNREAHEPGEWTERLLDPYVLRLA